ncbi:SCO4225 family membrane protein [Actinomadura verrucosospora]|uniref:SCO4225 family membrane protein n=1 Tax=Actinomadura verrucosospora TaxID=46165 RepID=UPI001565C1A1|nr:hypothetical protein [Actinomadura verrucosospora]
MNWFQRKIDGYLTGRIAAWCAGGYAAIVVGVTAFVVAAAATTENTFAAVWLLLVTLPTSLIVFFSPLPAGAATLIALIASGGFQAWLIWRLLRGRRMRPGGNEPA